MYTFSKELNFYSYGWEAYRIFLYEYNIGNIYYNPKNTVVNFCVVDYKRYGFKTPLASLINQDQIEFQNYYLDHYSFRDLPEGFKKIIEDFIM